MNAFVVRWRSARRFQETEIYADAAIGGCLFAALAAGGGLEIWQAGTLWKCPGCGDRTLRAEEFLEGMRRAERHLQRELALTQLEGFPEDDLRQATLRWIAGAAVQLLGCERDRVYLKEEGGDCVYARETYLSRI